jgi:hypothetical protein
MESAWASHNKGVSAGAKRRRAAWSCGVLHISRRAARRARGRSVLAAGGEARCVSRSGSRPFPLPPLVCAPLLARAEALEGPQEDHRRDRGIGAPSARARTRGQRRRLLRAERVRARMSAPRSGVAPLGVSAFVDGSGAEDHSLLPASDERGLRACGVRAAGAEGLSPSAQRRVRFRSSRSALPMCRCARHAAFRDRSLPAVQRCNLPQRESVSHSHSHCATRRSRRQRQPTAAAASRPEPPAAAACRLRTS